MKLKIIQLLWLSALLIIPQKISGQVTKPGQDDITITLSGELGSKNSTNIKTPGNWSLNYKIIYLPDEGSWVEKGDTVVIFDKQEIEKKLEEMSQAYEQLEKSLIEQQLTNEQQISDLENSIRSLKIQKKLVLNNLEQSKYNSESDQKSAELELKKVNLNIEKTIQSLKSTTIVNENSESETKLQIQQYEQRIDEYNDMLKGMYITAPRSGLIVYHRTGRRGKGPKVKIGDSIRPSRVVLKIPDLNNMIAKIDLNEVDISKVKEGQPARIRVLAYPDTCFSGSLSYISKIADEQEDSKLRVYPIEIDIDSKKNYRLKPGLTVKVNLTISQQDNSFSIPSWCLFKRNETFFVRTKKDEIKVDLLTISDGQAFIRAPLDTNMVLIENRSIPNF